MGWQEELRRLDAELADGQITHDQHRRLRDELLASASGGAMASPRISPRRRREQANVSAWRSTNPGSEPQPAPTPEPEPLAPEPAPPEPAKRPSSAAALLETDRPTTAPSPADHRRTESMPYPLLDQPTQVLRPTPALPPLTPIRTTPRSPRAPFMTAPARRTRKAHSTWLFISLGVLLVLVLIIGGAWWLGSGTDTTGTGTVRSNGSSTSATPSATGATSVAVEDRLPVLPGRASPDNSTVSVTKGAQLGFYSAADSAFMSENGATSVIYRGSAEGDRLSDGNTLLVVETENTRNAAAIVEHMRDSVSNLGFTPDPEADPGTTVLIGSNAEGRLKVDWYISERFAVGVGVSQALDGDSATLDQRLQHILSTLEPVLPRTG